MKVYESIVGFVRVLTRRQPRLYTSLGKLYHEFVFQKEKQYLRRKYPAALSVRYGQKTLRNIEHRGFSSQYGQDYFLLKYGLIPKISGTFIDIGCNDPVNTSNSHYLERNCSYKGIAVDPLDRFNTVWKKERPNTIFINSFVSDSAVDLEFVEVSGEHGWEDKLSGAVADLRLNGKNVSTKVRMIKPRRLPDILSDNGFEFGVSVLFVDVEGHEQSVLRSADWSDGKPKVIVIENTGPLKKQELLRSFIIGKGYSLIARIDIADDIFLSNDTSGQSIS